MARARHRLLIVTIAVGIAATGVAPGDESPCIAIPGYDDRCPAWTATYPSDAADVPQARFSAIATDPDGRVAFAAGSIDTENGYDMLTVAIDQASGTVLWSAAFDGPAGDGSAAGALAVSPDGATVYVSGFTNYTGIGTSYDIAVLAYDAVSGARRWEFVYDGPGGNADRVASMALDPSGDTLYVGGIRNMAPHGRANYDGEWLIHALDAATGDLRWEEVREQLTRFESVRGFAFGAGGAMYVVGQGEGPGGFLDPDYLTVAYDVSDRSRRPAVRWTAQLATEGTYDWNATGAIAVSDGAVVVTGGTDLAATTVAYDPRTGEQLWADSLTGTVVPEREGTDIVIHGGTAYVTGGSFTTEPVHDPGFWVVAYDLADGSRRWVGQVASPSSVFTVETGWSLGWHEPTQRLVASGAGNELIVAAIDPADGAVEWVGRHAWPGARVQSSTPMTLTGDRALVAGATLDQVRGLRGFVVSYDLTDAQGGAR